MIEHAKSHAVPIEVLLVDDNPGDVRLTREAMKDAKVHFGLHVSPDGVDAMAFLKREGAHFNAPSPDLILLDLNLPKMDGHEVLTGIKGCAILAMIPVVILNVAPATNDARCNCHMHAHGYLPKPMSPSGLVKVVQSIGHFWFTVVKLPMLVDVQEPLSYERLINLREANEQLVLAVLRAESIADAAVKRLNELAGSTQRPTLTDTPDRH
jgi:CheY-like chemotaxis protein